MKRRRKRPEAEILKASSTYLGIPVNKYATMSANGYKWCSLGQHWWHAPHIKRRTSIWCGPCEWKYRKGLKKRKQ